MVKNCGVGKLNGDMWQINARVDGMHAGGFIIYTDTSVISDITMVSAVGGEKKEKNDSERSMIICPAKASVERAGGCLRGEVKAP